MSFVIEDSRLLTVREFATKYNYHPKTVYRWIEKENMPCLRIHGRIRLDESDVIRWVEAGKEGG